MDETNGLATLAASAHPRLDALIDRARHAAGPPGAIALVYPGDALAMHAARQIAQLGVARPLLVGPLAVIQRAADAAQIDARDFEIVDTPGQPIEAARRAIALAREAQVLALMKGSLHTDELMAAVVERDTGLRADTRISHLFLFDLPRYPKLLGLTDCAVNIAPSLVTKRDILSNAIGLLKTLGISCPKVGILAAVETVNPAIQATVDAQALVVHAQQGAWPGAQVEGPFGFDNAFSADAARVKKMVSSVSGDADLLLVPDLNAGNMLYKSFTYVGGGECAGLVLGARVPLVMTSRADSPLARIASVALAVLATARTH
ncbi:MAG TPA: bifunctional enoyl-CoA hydratase/phosphate acetyltransferase [Ramlibacter sp.]|nr:bifunctional enoyl-CoA hydratase/phosphate acetyltransferase [Ramlibacter sp.]